MAGGSASGASPWPRSSAGADLDPVESVIRTAIGEPDYSVAAEHMVDQCARERGHGFKWRSYLAPQKRLFGPMDAASGLESPCLVAQMITRRKLTPRPEESLALIVERGGSC